MAETVTNRGKYRAMLALLNALGANAYMGVIVGNATGVNSATINTVADLDGLNAGATNIHTERKALTGGAATEDDANSRAAMDFADVSFAAAAGVSALGVFLFDNSGGTDATKDVIAIYTTGFPQPMDGGLNIAIADLLRAS